MCTIKELKLHDDTIYGKENWVFVLKYGYPTTEILLFFFCCSLILSLEEKEFRLKKLQERDDAHQDEITKLNSALHQAEKMLAEHKHEVQEFINQVSLNSSFLFFSLLPDLCYRRTRTNV